MSVVYSQVVTAADLLQSTIRIDELIQKMNEQHVEVAAITNSKMYGVLPFWHRLKEAGKQPVIGLTVDIQMGDVRRQVVLYSKTETGYSHIMKVSSASSLKEDGVLPLRWLEGYREGLRILIPLSHTSWEDLSEEHVRVLRDLFEEDCIVGVERPAGQPCASERAVVRLCETLQIPIGMTQRYTFLEEEDWQAYEVARAIDRGEKLSDREQSVETKYQYVHTTEEIERFYEDQVEWLDTMASFLTACQFDMPPVHFHMPKFPVKDGMTAGEMLRQQTTAFLQRQFSGNVPPPYKERLDKELGIIEQMGYSDYFLIVADYIEYARQQGILTGPGRGSSASSLVAFAMRITTVDPLQYGLLFERFLNPERVTLPDIDVDFADHRRQEVIQYVAEKYGAHYVSQIITFGTLSAKAVLRDVGRTYGLTMQQLSDVSKLIPSKQGVTLRDALQLPDGLAAWQHAHPKHDEIIRIALKLEGLSRNASTHAAGVVLSPTPLVETIPIEKGHDGMYLTQWPMQEVEQMGLLKMDFLGLRNLTTLEMIRNMIYADLGKMLKFEKIPFHDENTFALLRRGDTLGVFQLESTGMQEALREIAPTVFSDLIAINALYRPGPMAFIPVYARRKHGQEPIEMPHEALRDILEETYGVIVYQEQILQIAAKFAGFSMGEADLLRRAVSKKKKETLDQERTHFVGGARKQGYDEQTANHIYDLIVRFADYGFPKSHSAAYSVITYQLAYLKANFAPYFYAATLSSVLGDSKKMRTIMQEMKRNNVHILPPSITKSGRGFRVENGQVRFALGAIKGVPTPFLEELKRMRNNGEGKWTNLYTMMTYFPSALLKESTFEPLIKAGAFDEFGKDRSVLLASLKGALTQGSLQNDLVSGAGDLNDFALFGTPKYAKAEPMSEREKLALEKEVLGLYLSPHPIATLKKEHNLHVLPISRIPQCRAGEFVEIVGNVLSKKQIRTKKGEPMAFLQLEDEDGHVDATLFPRTYNQVISWLKEDQNLIVKGKIEVRNGKPQVIVKELRQIIETEFNSKS